MIFSVAVISCFGISGGFRVSPVRQSLCKKQTRQFASSAAVRVETGTFKDNPSVAGHARARACRKRLGWAYQCLTRGVSKCAPFLFVGQRPEWRFPGKANMPQRKARPRSNRDRPHPLDFLDEATDSCAKIAALAQLLASCQTERLRSETVAVAGALIMDEIAKLRGILNLLCHQRPQPPHKRGK